MLHGGEHASREEGRTGFERDGRVLGFRIREGGGGGGNGEEGRGLRVQPLVGLVLGLLVEVFVCNL